jgi:hypothetical protein
MSIAQQLATPSKLNARTVATKAPATQHQLDIFAAALAAHNAVSKAAGTVATRTEAVIVSTYGDVCPTFAQFKADRAALKMLAEAKGLTSDQWVRKPYNAAIVKIFGGLPVAMTEAAILKRAQRMANTKNGGTDNDDDDEGQDGAKSGAVKGKTSVRNPSASESVEQLVARIGIFATLKAITAILSEDASTKPAANKLKAIEQEMQAKVLRDRAQGGVAKAA